MFMSSSGTNYVLHDHGDLGQCGPYAIPSEIVLYYSQPASLVDLFDNPINRWMDVGDHIPSAKEEEG